MKYASSACAANRVVRARPQGQFRCAAERMGQHPAIGDDHVVAAAGAAQAREHDGFIGIEIDAERGRNTRVKILVGEALV